MFDYSYNELKEENQSLKTILFILFSVISILVILISYFLSVLWEDNTRIHRNCSDDYINICVTAVDNARVAVDKAHYEIDQCNKIYDEIEKNNNNK